jgi:hypothetical protein
MSNRNDGPIPRLRQLGEEKITLPVGSGLSISWLTLQVILFFVACLICACCSISSYVWSSVTLQITVPAPVITPRTTPPPAATGAETELASPTAETAVPVSPIQTPTPEATSEPPTPTPMSPSTPLPTPANVPPPPPAGSPPAQAQMPLPTGMPQPPTGLSGLRIVRVEWLPVGEEWGEEHIVIENQGADDQDLSGWTMNNDKLNTYRFPEGFVLHSQSQVRVWAKGGTDTDSDLYWGSEQEIGDNAGGTIYLRDPAGTLIDLSSWKPTEGDSQSPSTRIILTLGNCLTKLRLKPTSQALTTET